MSDGSRPDRDAAIKLARDSLALIFWHFVLEKVDCDDDDDDDDDDNDDDDDITAKKRLEMSKPVPALVLSGLDYRSRIQYYQVHRELRYAVLNKPCYLSERKMYEFFTPWVEARDTCYLSERNYVLRTEWPQL